MNESRHGGDRIHRQASISRITALAAIVALVAALAGCRGKGTAAAHPQLTVSAASSLQKAIGQYADGFDAAEIKASFAGSDELAAQIQSGLKPDVFAAANTKLPQMLYAKGLVHKPVVFAANRLVIAVPAGSNKVRSLDDLAGEGVTVAAGSPSVPVGAYTRKLLGELPTARRGAIVANIRSNEPDVKGVVGKLTQGAVDAGFVYITDVNAANGKLRSIELPGNLNPSVAYGIAIVTGAKHPAEAQKFIDGLLSGTGQAALTKAGFKPPPK
ncbi:MAG: molybdate ABC transporter substrate-binding protein [Thermoleophilia bacterium]|nr:molybdate ABC transporter substrate-binding protein [Thermoleophilia bacterium]